MNHYCRWWNGWYFILLVMTNIHSFILNLPAWQITVLSNYARMRDFSIKNIEKYFSLRLTLYYRSLRHKSIPTENKIKWSVWPIFLDEWVVFQQITPFLFSKLRLFFPWSQTRGRPCWLRVSWYCYISSLSIGSGGYRRPLNQGVWIRVRQL